MTAKASAPEPEAPVVDPQAEIAELRTRAEEAEQNGRDLEETANTLDGMVSQYKQWLGEAQLELAQVNAKYSIAVRRLNAASVAQ
jgi:chromosome segregation ATPase